jgi:hypothetical protein
MEAAAIPPVSFKRPIPDTAGKLWYASSMPIPAGGIWQALNPTQQRNVLDTLVRVCCHLAYPDRHN